MYFTQLHQFLSYQMNDSAIQSLIYSMTQLVETQKVQNALIAELVYWTAHHDSIPPSDYSMEDILNSADGYKDYKS